jgi:Flp pilus assembly protein TadB
MSVNERPLSVVLQDIVRNIQDIVKSEVRLAKTEVREELHKTRAAGTLLAVGAVSGLFCVAFVLLAVMHSLSLVMPSWAAALCVAAIVGVLAVVMIAAGVKRFKTINAAAPRTVASIKENVEWAKQQTK